MWVIVRTSHTKGVNGYVRSAATVCRNAVKDAYKQSSDYCYPDCLFERLVYRSKIHYFPESLVQ